jgi:RNA polymerase sigma factor (sigma-70 family)
MSIPKTVDCYDALGGETLSCHFTGMDRVLWKALALIAQTDPEYLQRCALQPITREICGTSYGRRWFIADKSGAYMCRMLELDRVWLQKYVEWDFFLKQLQTLTLFRDTLRGWVENYEGTHELVSSHVTEYFNTYIRLRKNIVTSYIPVVWKVAMHHGFTEDQQHDLFQIGITGLLHATERYNNEGPMTFPKFAHRWIRQAVHMHIDRKMPLISVSHSVKEANSKLNKQEKHAGQPDTSLRAKKIRQLLAMKDVVLTDQLEFEHEAEDDIINLDILDPFSKKIIILRHGLLEHACCTLTRQELEQEYQRQKESV